MLKYIVIHNSAVSNKVSPQLFAVNRYHKEKYNMKSSLGWYVGYNEFVDIDGTRTKCRVYGEETAAVIGHNLDSYHICFALDGDKEEFNQKQINSFREIMSERSDLELKLHRELQEGRSCPGMLITQLYLKGFLKEEFDKKDMAFYKSQLDYLMGLLIKLLALIKK